MHNRHKKHLLFGGIDRFIDRFLVAYMHTQHRVM